MIGLRLSLKIAESCSSHLVVQMLQIRRLSQILRDGSIQFMQRRRCEHLSVIVERDLWRKNSRGRCNEMITDENGVKFQLWVKIGYI